MKFGKYLAARQLELPEYSSYFINYKQLKKLINVLSKDNTTTLQDKKGSFFFRLERELEKVNEFYLEKESELRFRLDLLIQKKNKSIKNNLIYKNSINFISLYDGFKKFSKDLDRLQQFVELNETGFTKVLKKWDKRSKSTTKELYLSTAVNVQPIFHRNQIIELSDLVANNLMELEALNDGEKNFIIYDNDKDKDREIDIDIDNNTIENETIDNSFNNNNELTDQLYTDFYEITLQNANLPMEEQIIKLKEWSNQIISKLNNDKKQFTFSKVFMLLIVNFQIPDNLLLKFYDFFKEFINLEFIDDINGRNCLIETSTCKFGRNEIIKICLNSNINPSIKDITGKTCLHYLTENGRDDLLILILSYIKNDENFNIENIIDIQDNDSITPLLLAIINNHISTIKILLDFNANGFPKQDDLKPSYLPLNVACKFGNFEIVELLLHQYGSFEKAKLENLLINPSQCNAEGLLPLHIVASSGNYKLVPLLLQYGADINQLDKLNKWSSIFYSIFSNDSKMTKILIDYGADFNLKDEDGFNPLYYAIWEGNIPVFNILLESMRDKRKNSIDDIDNYNNNQDNNNQDNDQGNSFNDLIDIDNSNSAININNNNNNIPNLDKNNNNNNKISIIDSVSLKPLNSLNSLIDFTNIDSIPELSLPPPIIPLRKYGHNFLEKRIFFKLSFYTNRYSIKLNPDTFLSSVPGRITISTDDSIPRNILLPVLDSDKVITFQLDSIDDEFYKFEFELFPTFGTRSIAKAILSSSILRTQFPGIGCKNAGDLDIPLLDYRLRTIGSLKFTYEIIYPYSGIPLEISMYDTYWKLSSSTEDDKLQQQEQQQQQQQQQHHQSDNDVLYSFVTSSSLNGEYFGTHICLLNDGTPLVCPKFEIEISENVIFPISTFNYQQLKNFIYKNDEELNQIKENLKNINKDELKNNFHKIMSNIYLPLDDFLESINNSISLNLEIFYPSTYELKNFDMKEFAFTSDLKKNDIINNNNNSTMSSNNNLNNYIDLILTIIFNHVRKLRLEKVKSRQLVLSSNNPTVCTILNWKQPNYPVFYNLNGIRYNNSNKKFIECSSNGIIKNITDNNNSNNNSNNEIKLNNEVVENKISIDNIDSINKDSYEYINSLEYEDKLTRSIKLAVNYAVSNNLLGITVPEKILNLSPEVVKSIRGKGLILVASKDDSSEYLLENFINNNEKTNENNNNNDIDDDIKILEQNGEIQANGLRFNDILTFTDAIEM